MFSYKLNFLKKENAMKRNILILMVVMLMTALALPAFAQSIDTVLKGNPNKEFTQWKKKCPKGICASEDDAAMANMAKDDVIDHCNSVFGATKAAPCINKLLGKWKGITFKAGTVVATTNPCEPNPCEKGQTCHNVKGKAVCKDAAVATAPKTKWCPSLKKRIPVGQKCPPVQKPVIKPPVEPPATSSFSTARCSAGAICKEDLCISEGSNRVVLKGERCPSFDPWHVTWVKDPGACPEGYTTNKIDHPDRPAGCYAEGTPEDHLGKPDSRYLCSIWNPEPRSWSQENPIAAAWLAVGLPLGLILLALIGFLVYWLFFRKKEGEAPVPPPEGALATPKEASEELLDSVADVVNPMLEGLLSLEHLEKFKTFVARRLENGQSPSEAMDGGYEDLKQNLASESSEPSPE